MNKFDPINNYEFDMPSAIPFILFHLSCFAVLLTGVTVNSLILCFILYVVRMWAVTGVYHRYFSHKAYSTSRIFQFMLAFLAQSSLQQGILWWANHHRKHHMYSDTLLDTHSPRHRGFWFSHVGWIFTKAQVSREYSMVKDWQKFPELVWLDKNRYLPGTLLGIVVWLCAGWTGLVVGFCISTVILFHSTFTINSLSHLFGKQRYITGDDSRNNWLLAILTLGEGWHNNHHYYPTTAKAGFRWWELDITYYVLKILAFFHLVWDLKPLPQEVKNNTCAVPHNMAIRSREMLHNAALNIEQSIKYLHELAAKASKLLEEPSSSFNKATKDMHVAIQQFIIQLQEQARKVEQLPPKLAKIVKKKFASAAAILERITKHNENKRAQHNIIEALQSAAKTLEIPELALSVTSA